MYLIRARKYIALLLNMYLDLGTDHDATLSPGFPLLSVPLLLLDVLVWTGE